MKNKVRLFLENRPVLLKLVRVIYNNTWLQYKKHNREKNYHNFNKKALFSAVEVFEELGIDYWLDYGTLLGAIREQGFIAHDVDIDLATFIENRSEKLIKILEKCGFIKKYEFALDGIIREESFDYKGINVDIFYYKKVLQKVTGYYFLPEKGKSRVKTIQDRGGLIPIEVVFPFDKTDYLEFLGKKVKVPANYVEYIVAHYGKNYTEPIEEWDNLTSPYNINILTNKLGVYKEV